MPADVDRYRASLEMAVPRQRYGGDLDMAVGVGTEVSDRARIHPSARIGRDVRIESGASIGRNVIVGDGAYVASNVSLAEGSALGLSAMVRDGARVGPGSVVGDRATVFEGARVGADCIVGAGAQLGRDVKLGDDSRVGEYCVLASDVSTGREAMVGTGPWTRPGPSGRAPTAADHVPVLIDGETRLGDRVSVAPGAYVGRGCDLRAGASVGEAARVDEQTLLQAGARVGRDAHVGPRSVLGKGAAVADFSTTGEHTVVRPGERLERRGDRVNVDRVRSGGPGDQGAQSRAGRLAAGLVTAVRRLAGRTPQPTGAAESAEFERAVADRARPSAISTGTLPRIRDHRSLVAAHEYAFGRSGPAVPAAPARPNPVAAYRRARAASAPAHARSAGAR